MESVFQLTAIFTFSDEKVNGYYIGKRKVRTTVFGKRTVTAYVTSTEKEKGTRRLFLSTVSEESVSIPKENLPDSIEKHFDLLPMFLYQIRWEYYADICIIFHMPIF